MSDEQKNPSTTPTPNQGKEQSKTVPTKKERVDNGLANLSAQISPDIMPLLDAAADQLDCTRADIIREAVRFFVNSCYQGKGQWSIPESIVDDMPYACTPAYSAKKLPR